MATTRRGRRPKGRRAAFTVKVPEDQKPLLEEKARAAGLPLCDYVAVILAQHHGYDAPSYLDTAHGGHPELPISA